MSLVNDFVGMLDRTYEQNRDAIKERISQYIPEITNHSETEVLIKALSVWYGLIEMSGYNLDIASRELFLKRAKLYKSLVGIAEMFDYRVKGRNSATVDLRFFLNQVATSIVTIPSGTEVQTSDGIKYFTTQAAQIGVGEIDVTVAAIQQESVTGANLGTTQGVANESVALSIQKIVDKSLQLTINSIVWNPVNTLTFSSPTAKEFVQSIDEDGNTKIQFGDDKTGDIPPASFTIFGDYKISEGALGNVAPFQINTINSAISLDPGFTITVENRESASGGTNEETADEIRKNVTLSLRTLERGVTSQDYSDLAELVSGVAKAGTRYDCGKVIEVFITPVGGGLASSGLIADVQTWLDERKMITTKVTVLAAGEVDMILTASVVIGNSYLKATVRQAIKDALTAKYSADTMDVGGSVFLSDIYEVIEGTDGVLNSQINLLSSIPFARILNGTTPLIWDRAVLEDSTTTIQWQITMTSGTVFQLFKDGSFVGNFNVADVITFPEIQFTVNASSYNAGDKWEFFTYRYNGTIHLDEMSVPIFQNANINLQITGGV